MLYAIFLSALVALFFAGPLMFRKKDWSYGETKYDAKGTRQTGYGIFIIIFFIILVLWGSGGY